MCADKFGFLRGLVYILSIQYSIVSICGCVYVVMTVYLNILPEFDKNSYIVSLDMEKGE